ncbi:hypothetical protein M1349_00330 [Patescibacteria group bacterium]|nr:hypothetical protein [Patescibacteria group bacterium]
MGAFFYPLASIDAVSIWLLKAKAFYLWHGNLPLDILKDSVYLNSHPQYPILVPFIYFSLYFLFGGINEQIIAFINPIFYVLVLLVAYKVFRKLNFNQIQSLLFTYIYSMFSPLLAQGGRKHSGDVDIFIVFLNWTAILLTLNFIKTKSNKILGLIVFLIMIASQVKGEGIFLATLLFFLPIKRNLKLFLITISFIPFLVWRLIVFNYGIPNDFYFLVPSVSEIFNRSFNIFYYTLREMLKINNWYVFWPVFLTFLVFIRSKNNFMNKIIGRSLILYSLLFFIFYLFSSVPPNSYVSSSIDRILLQLSPFYFLIFADLVKTVLSNNFLNKSLKITSK